MADRWRSGLQYLIKVRATDKAGNVQDDTLEQWTKFSVSLPAKTFAVSIIGNQNPTAGDPVSVRIEARDQNGDPALNYLGRVRFSVDGPIASPAGPSTRMQAAKLRAGCRQITSLLQATRGPGPSVSFILRRP